MTDFDYVCLFLAIPIGLALTEMAQGISVALRRRQELKIGWLTPLLVFFVLLLVAIVLEAFWGVRESVTVGAPLILTGLIATLTFYVAASFVFPDRIDPGVSMDDWFMRNRQISLGGTALIALAFFFAYLTTIEGSEVDYPVIWYGVWLAFFAVAFAPVVLAIRTRQIARARMAMAALNLFYVGIFVLIVVT